MINSPRLLRRALQIVAGGLVFCLLSLLITDTRSAGMGTHGSYGFPRSFYFTWMGIDSGTGSSGVNWLYFMENWVIYIVALAIMATVRRHMRKPMRSLD